MSKVDLKEAAKEMVRRTTEAQGLPYYIEDEATIRQFVELARNAGEGETSAA